MEFGIEKNLVFKNVVNIFEFQIFFLQQGFMNNETETENSSSQQTVEVEAQLDHLETLTKAKPIFALAELIWNALDADANEIKIGIFKNASEVVETITIQDNGTGIPIQDSKVAFGNLGGSWKKMASKTKIHGRNLHGRSGKGRFKAFALGHWVTWETTFQENNEFLRYEIKGSKVNLKSFKIGNVEKVNIRTKGTTLTITGLDSQFTFLSDDSTAVEQLSEHFALYLRDYPNVKIYFNTIEINPALVQKEVRVFPIQDFLLEDQKQVNASFEIIEWAIKKKHRKIILCDENGFMLHEVDAGVRFASEFNVTSYLRSEFIAELNNENSLEAGEMNTGLVKLIEHAREHLRTYFREKKAGHAAEIVQNWKTEGIYPFLENPGDTLEKVRREVFDICALNAYEYLDSFRDGKLKDRKFILRMLQSALDQNPNNLRIILTEILELPQDKQKDLADLLRHTTLSSIIETTRVVVDRLKFLAGLEEILFNKESKKKLEERNQLHRILETETWIFGDEFLLTGSDEGLTTVLRKHIDKLRPPAKIEGKGKQKKKMAPVLRDDGSEGRIDMLLARNIPPAYGKEKQEYLVIELKRPSQKIDLTIKGQIEDYALAVIGDERFDHNNTYWTFIAISNEINEQALKTIRQADKPKGFFMTLDNCRVGLATWSEVILANRTRLHQLKERLGYTATKDQGVELLHTKYNYYLPNCLKENKL